MSLFADNTLTQVRRPGNPHTSVRGANRPYDRTAEIPRGAGMGLGRDCPTPQDRGSGVLPPENFEI